MLALWLNFYRWLRVKPWSSRCLCRLCLGRPQSLSSERLRRSICCQFERVSLDLVAYRFLSLLLAALRYDVTQTIVQFKIPSSTFWTALCISSPSFLVPNLLLNLKIPFSLNSPSLNTNDYTNRNLEPDGETSECSLKSVSCTNNDVGGLSKTVEVAFDLTGGWMKSRRTVEAYLTAWMCSGRSSSSMFWGGVAVRGTTVPTKSTLNCRSLSRTQCGELDRTYIRFTRIGALRHLEFCMFLTWNTIPVWNKDKGSSSAGPTRLL